MNAPSPDELFADYLRRGEPARFAELHDLLRGELIRVAQRLAPDRSTAEDLVQATFLGAIESAGRFERGRKVVPWLIGILQNQARVMRWRARRAPDPQRLPWPEPRDPAELAADREFEQVLANAFARLGPVYAPVMERHLRDEMSAQDIGDELRRPAGTVRTQVVRGTALLRSLLPSGVASLLLVRASPGLDAAGVRDVLLEHAGRGRVAGRPPWAQPRTAWLTAAGLVAAAAAAFAWGMPREHDRAATPSGGAVVAASAEPAPEAVPAAGGLPPASPPAERVLVPAAATTLVVAVTHQGLPAASLPVHAISIDDWRFHRHTQLTDADGVARFVGLPAGKWFVLPASSRTDREAALVDIVAGRPHERQVAVPRVATLAGRAVDENDAPLADATVWLCDGDYQHTFGFGAVPVAMTDAAGSFVVRSCPGGAFSHVQVTAPGRRASELRQLPHQQDETQRFTLAADGAAVQGAVVDGRGAVLAGVLVRARHAGERSRLTAVSADGTFVPFDRHGATREVRTDAAGRFCIDGFDRGREVAVTVWEAAFARHEATLLAGGPPLAVALSPGTTLHGRVTDDGGKPVRDAVVTAAAVDDDDPMGSGVRTNEDGHYLLAGVTPGEAVAVTVKSMPNPVDGSGGAGNATAVLRLVPGSTREWSPRLQAGHVFRGTLTMSDGSAFDGWTFDLIAIDDVDGTNYFPVRLGKRGDFEVKNVPRSRYWLQANHDDCVILQFVVQWPLADRFDIVVQAAIAQASIRYFAEFRNPSTPTGTLDVRGFEPGRGVGFQVFAVGDRERWAASPHALTWQADRSCMTVALAPGRYELAVSGAVQARDALAIADHALPFTVAARETTSLQAVERLGVARCFRIEEPSPHFGSGGAFVEVRDADGKLVSRKRCMRSTEPAPGALEASVVVTPGRYRIEVETDLGHRGALDFTVDALVPFAHVVPLPVR